MKVIGEYVNFVNYIKQSNKEKNETKIIKQ